MKHVSAALLAAFAVCAFSTPLQSRRSETLGEWLCRVLRVDPKVYTKLLSVRKGPEELSGDRIAIADLQNRKESIVYSCGSCLSPLPVPDGTIAFLRTDGLWTVGRTGENPKLVVKGLGLRSILGRVGNARDKLLVLRYQPDSAGCKYSVGSVDITAGTIGSPGTSEDRCNSDAEVMGVFRRDAIRGTRVVETSPPGSGVRHLVQWTMSDDELAVPIREPLLSWAASSGVAIERFDPVWIDETHVLYLQKQ